MSQKDPCVLVGVTGCIAAYKACNIVRGLQKAGVRCKVVMTENASKFVGPTTFRALTREPVAIGLFDDPSDPIHHISLAQECDVFVIAPCTANVVAKIAHGIADDLLTTTALAVRAPLMIAPAMNVAMYEAPATQANLEALRKRGVHIIDPAFGYQACGDVGRGRMPEPDAIVSEVLDVLGKPKAAARDMENLHVMITAGPTVEPIDAVRYISNHSSGKMGYALAAAAVERGAKVTLVSGPVSIEPPKGVELVRVKSAREMLCAAEESFTTCDIAVFSAAVADFRPERASASKLKKGKDSEALKLIQLVENPDILKTLAGRKTEKQFVVGFAAETNDLVANAEKKLSSKNADMIVANEVGGGLAFGTDDNHVVLVTIKDALEIPAMPKRSLADVIFDNVLSMRHA